MGEITISLKDLGMILIGTGIIVLLAYLILFVKNLIPSAKSMARIMADAEVVSSIAREGAEETEKMIGDLSSSVSSVADIIKGNQSTISALTSIINALGSLNNLLKKRKSEGEK